MKQIYPLHFPGEGALTHLPFPVGGHIPVQTDGTAMTRLVMEDCDCENLIRPVTSLTTFRSLLEIRSFFPVDRHAVFPCLRFVATIQRMNKFIKNMFALLRLSTVFSVTQRPRTSATAMTRSHTTVIRVSCHGRAMLCISAAYAFH